MSGRAFLSKDPAWLKLKNLYDSASKNLKMLDLFSADSSRFEKFRCKSLDSADSLK